MPLRQEDENFYKATLAKYFEMGEGKLVAKPGIDAVVMQDYDPKGLLMLALQVVIQYAETRSSVHHVHSACRKKNLNFSTSR